MKRQMTLILFLKSNLTVVLKYLIIAKPLDLYSLKQKLTVLKHYLKIAKPLNLAVLININLTANI